MRPVGKAALGLGIVLGFALGEAGPGRSHQPLGAVPTGPLTDSDGDNVPDVVEWVAHSNPDLKDTDGDGRSDFVELIEYTSPIDRDIGRTAPDGFRILLSTSDEGTQKVLWIHLLLRFSSGLVTDLKGLSLFLDSQGNRYPLTDLLFLAVAEVRSVQEPLVGTLTRVTLKVPMVPELQNATPVVFGGYAMTNSGLHRTGALLWNKDSAFHTFTVLGKTLLLEATSPTEGTNPFWTTNKNCVFTLQVQGVGFGGYICEVMKADCEIANTRRCTSACSKVRGLTFFAPDGLSLITGG